MTARERVLAVYADVDRQVAAAGPRCDASGRCCRFDEYGHTLFLSQFEADILLATAPHYDKPVSRATCPFQIDNLCTARDERPLGCRIYFCDPTYQTRQNEITETAIAALKTIADDTDAGWRYAPLHVFLNDADRPAVSPIASSRIPLALSKDAP
jgi:Fe-S-cluster containining protein